MNVSKIASGDYPLKSLFKALAMLLLLAAIAPVIQAGSGPPIPQPPANVSSIGVIADAHEPGQRLEISGQVFAPDGTTPVANVIVYAYQTDATGEYRNDPNTRVARLHGWAKTDARGRYAFHTIKPAPYPGRSIAAHVHIHVWGAGYPLQWTPELLFAGDPFLKSDQIATSQALGKFANVQTLQAAADGALSCIFNIRISAASNYK
jgi:protocatechuate 3,4-dioxygenase beta subunit